MSFVYWIHTADQVDMFSSGYVGVTTKTVEERFAAHIRNSNKGMSNHLYRAMRLYGVEELLVEAICAGSTEYCFEVEGNLRPDINTGWNMAVGGKVSPMTSCGHSDETKEKIRLTSTGRIHSENTKAKIGSAHKGKILSDSTKKLLSDWRTGKPMPIEVAAKISASAMGRKNTAEHTKNISDGLKGLKKTEAHCEAMSLAKKGIPFSMERRLNQSRIMIEKGPWNNAKANKEVWAIAEELSPLCQMYGLHNLSKLFGLSKSNLVTLQKKVLAGWLPQEDSQYQTWLSEYKQNKEAENVP